MGMGTVERFEFCYCVCHARSLYFAILNLLVATPILVGISAVLVDLYGDLVFYHSHFFEQGQFSLASHPSIVSTLLGCFFAVFNRFGFATSQVGRHAVFDLCAVHGLDC